MLVKEEQLNLSKNQTFLHSHLLYMPSFTISSFQSRTKADPQEREMEQALVGRGEHPRPQCMGILGAVLAAECRGHAGRWWEEA